MKLSQSLWLAGAAMGAALAIAPGEAVAQTTQQPQQFAQVTSVSQLSDVQPTDWWFSALQSLVERYGCIAGYPDGTYRGNRALTRGEFAAGLNACLDRINELIAAGLADKVSREDLATVQRLQEEFAAELAALSGRVDALEAKTAELEANPLGLNAVTSRLSVEVKTGIFAASDPIDSENNAILPYRIRLNFDTSFTGEDRFRIRLQARENSAFIGDPVGLGQGESSGAGSDVNDDVDIDDTFYEFPLFNGRVTGLFGLVSVEPSRLFILDNVLSGGISDLAEMDEHLTHNTLVDSTALGFSWEAIEDLLFISYGYGADDASESTLGNGLFAGESVHVVEVGFTPVDSLTLVAAYANYAAGQGDDPGPGTPINDIPGDAQAATFGVNWEITPRIVFQGYYTRGFFSEDAVDDTNDFIAGFAFSDYFIEGSNGGILVGSPDSLAVSQSFDLDGEDLDEFPIQIEAWYGFPVTNNITITPGVYYITNINNDGDDIIVGGVETTFRF
ncbi:iron uptake porin [Synechococcus sp. PCC 7336]|uniref:iron uptake porin n=1 Tax=Synechococcus sp. PCC 7336 TaxID=195250 RepID=UPI00034AA65E|nr:iron uptake porin [Synechococcus sp. PCC 7336]